MPIERYIWFYIGRKFFFSRVRLENRFSENLGFLRQIFSNEIQTKKLRQNVMFNP